MSYRIFNFEKHGYSGYMELPKEKSQLAVIVVAGGRDQQAASQMIVKTFASHGYVGFSVSLHESEDEAHFNNVPLDLLKDVVHYLKVTMRIPYVVIYGYGYGAVAAPLAADLIGEIDGMIMVSGIHCVYEGTIGKKPSGQPVVTFEDHDLPFVPAHLYSAQTYEMFSKAFLDKEKEAEALLPFSRLTCPLLLIGSDSDPIWPSGYAMKYVENLLKDIDYPYGYEVVIYHNASHMLGVLPSASRINSSLLRRHMSRRYRHYHKIHQEAQLDSQKRILAFLQKIMNRA